MSLPHKRPTPTRRDTLGIIFAVLAGVITGTLTRDATWGAVAFLVTVITARAVMLGIKPKKG